MGAWGTTSFGPDSYGGGGSNATAAGFDLLRAWAPTAQTIRLEFSAAPRALGDRTPADALTRGNLTLSVVSGSREPAPRLLGVTRVGLRTLEVTLAGELEGAGTRYRMDLATTLRSASGEAIGVSAGLFHGLTTPRTDRAGASRAEQLTYPALGDLRSPNGIGGTLTTTPEGDYDLAAGKETLRKLIIRRLITPTGGFAHLPKYGLSLTHGRTLPPAFLASLRGEIREQVRLEPEVADAQVELQHQVGRGVLVIRVAAQMRGGAGEASVELPVLIGGAS